MKKLALCIAFLAAALVMVIGCQNDHGINSNSSDTQSLQPRHRSHVDDGGESWDQLGIDHNRGLAYIDSRLSAKWDSTWTRDSTYSFMGHCVIDFIRDSTNYDAAAAESLWLEWHLLEYIDSFSYENLPDYVDSLKAANLISSREQDYLNRLTGIVVEYLKGNIDSAAMSDSLESYEAEILSISWEEDETLCLSLSSVALYSWDYRTSTWYFPGEGVPVDSWARFIGHDLGGAVGGFLLGGPEGALVGACLESGLVVYDEICDRYNW